MITLLIFLRFVGELAAVIALACIGYEIARSFPAMVKNPMGDTGESHNWFWVGLIYAAVWMACQIGAIGL
jgi:hypothetical protein